ncbi:MAG: helix-turn-helix domain-containing protein [Pelolinea sp.]|nr:helix-turn-helix domain-containing protein [Pelolinea sp.]
MNPGHHIDYKQLRKVNPKTARLTVLSYLESVGGNISRTAQVFGVNRSVVYDILKKQASGDLNDRSKAPRRHMGQGQEVH